jgi:hypothetical protein
LFRRELERALSDGTGELSGQYVLHDLPALLGLEEKKVGIAR